MSNTDRQSLQASSHGPVHRYLFPSRLRLTHAREYQAAYSTRASRTLGPLVLFSRPNEFQYPRLGLAVSRRVGQAHIRHRIKRLLREAFRHLQRDLPVGYDFVIRVRPHSPLTLAEYQKILSQGMRRLHRHWQQAAGPSNKSDDHPN